MSLNLLESAQQIITNNPEYAEPVYDMILFMAQPDAVLSPEFDETKEMLYAMTADARANRERYEEKKVAA